MNARPSRPVGHTHFVQQADDPRGRGRLMTTRRRRPHRFLDLVHRVSEGLERIVEPDLAVWSILAAFTAGEGLGFNRAYLMLAEGDQLKGYLGVGPRTREEAREVWSEMRRSNVRPLDRLGQLDPETIVCERERHSEVLAALTQTVKNCGGWHRAFVARSNHPVECVRHWVEVLDSAGLVVVPLMTEERPWGVILADNFVTQAPIYLGTLETAETLAHYLHAALERTQLVERLQEEKRRRLAAEHAEALLEAARSLAHDLKNPLALAGGLATELVDGPSGDPATLARRLQIISGAIRRAEERVAELADGLASRAHTVKIEAVEVGSIAERVAEAFRPLATARHVRLLCYHPSRPVVAAAAIEPLERCLENLLGNAIQVLSDRGGEVHMSVNDDTRWVRLVVADNGPPLPLVMKSDPFAGGFTTRHSGSGLGLASVRALAEAMGGQVEYDDHEAGWVRFTVLLRRWS